MSGFLTSVLGQLIPTIPTPTQSKAQSQAQSQVPTQAQTQAQAPPTVAAPSPSSSPSPNAVSSPAVTQASTAAQGNAPATTSNPNPAGSDSPPASDGSNQSAQSRTLASAPATSVSDGRTNAPGSTSIPSNEQNSFASSEPSNIQSLLSTTFATSVSSSKIPSTLSTSNLASIETAAGTGDGYSQTSGNNSKDASKAPVAGVVVASVLGLMLGAAIIFLIFRYYKPMRQKREAWQERKLLEKTYYGGMSGSPEPNESKMMEQSPQYGVGPFAAYKIHASSEETLIGQEKPLSKSTRMAETKDAGLRSGNQPLRSTQNSPVQTSQRPASRGAVYTVFPPAWHYNRDLPLPPLPR